MLRILKQCQKKLQSFPEEIRGDLADLLAGTIGRRPNAFDADLKTNALDW